MEEVMQKEKLRLGISHSLIAKILAFILAIAMLAVGALGVLTAVMMAEYDVYNTDKKDFYEELCDSIAYSDAQNIAYHVGIDDLDGAVKIINRKNIDGAKIICEGQQNWTWSCGWVENDGGTVCDALLPYSSYDNGYAIPDYGGADGNYMTVKLRIAEKPTANYDEYTLAYLATQLSYGLMHKVYLVILTAAVLFILSVIFLLNAAGHRRKKEGVTPSWTTKIPFDLLSAVAFLFGVFSVFLIEELSWHTDYMEFVIFCMGLILVADAVVALLWLMSAALRIKLGRWWECTVIFMALRLCWRAVKWAWRKCRKLLGKIWSFNLRLFSGIGLFWKASIVFAAVCVLEFIVILATQWGMGAEIVLWFIEKLVFLTGLIFLCGFLNELYKCGKNVAEGNMDYEVNTRGMPSRFREHAENLRSLSGAVSKAVEQRMVSERMKTELITNVSHDLKTPLTSLINYSDLICREACDNPRHGEYAEVLNRQSQRMKRLIDDLVEASKASSGNMDIELAPLRADVLLSQAAGEYEQRFVQQGLECHVKNGDKPVSIMADGRRLWRVLDNLMGNICKYALPGTRVYLALEEKGGKVELSFKNTSREMLDLSPEELMERFVRGDSSRSSEGSGLGLSIARSLTQLQGGEMDIVCDGDLFKVTLSFPAVK